MTTLVAALDPSAFDPLVQELTRERVAVNYDRHQAGKGRSQAFGIIRRWSYRPHLARNTWGRPRLWQLILDFAAEHVPIPWDGCTVNDCYESREHTDKGNQGQSYTVSFGNFTGGLLAVRGQGGTLAQIDTRHTGYLFDGSKHVHWTTPFQGQRFCLVFYSIIWPTKFLPRYKVTCKEQSDGLLIDDEYDESSVVVDRKGHVVRVLKTGKPVQWVGRLTKFGQPSRLCTLAAAETQHPPVLPSDALVSQ